MDFDLLKMVISVVCLILCFLMIVPLIVCLIFAPKIGLFFLAGMMSCATLGMILGDFAASKFGKIVDYKKNKIVVIIAWLVYIMMSIGLFGVAIYENFIYNG